MIQVQLSALLILVTSSGLLCGCDAKMESSNAVVGRRSTAVLVPATGATTGSVPGNTVAVKDFDCLTCHTKDSGPGTAPPFALIAHVYSGDAAGKSVLASSLKNGSHNKWGGYHGAAMPPKPQLSDGEVDALVQWVLDQQKQEKAKPSPAPGSVKQKGMLDLKS